MGACDQSIGAYNSWAGLLLAACLAGLRATTNLGSLGNCLSVMRLFIYAVLARPVYRAKLLMGACDQSIEA